MVTWVQDHKLERHLLFHEDLPALLWERPPDTDSPSGHPPPLQLGPLFPFWKKGPHVYYLLFIKLIPSDSGIGNHEKNYHKHQDQLADKCLLGNHGVWSWSRGSL